MKELDLNKLAVLEFTKLLLSKEELIKEIENMSSDKIEVMYIYNKTTGITRLSLELQVKGNNDVASPINNNDGGKEIRLF